LAVKTSYFFILNGPLFLPQTPTIELCGGAASFFKPSWGGGFFVPHSPEQTFIFIFIFFPKRPLPRAFFLRFVFFGEIEKKTPKTPSVTPCFNPKKNLFSHLETLIVNRVLGQKKTKQGWGVRSGSWGPLFSGPLCPHPHHTTCRFATQWLWTKTKCFCSGWYYTPLIKKNTTPHPIFKTTFTMDFLWKTFLFYCYKKFFWGSWLFFLRGAAAALRRGPGVVSCLLYFALDTWGGGGARGMTTSYFRLL